MCEVPFLGLLLYVGFVLIPFALRMPLRLEDFAVSARVEAPQVVVALEGEIIRRFKKGVEIAEKEGIPLVFIPCVLLEDNREYLEDVSASNPPFSIVIGAEGSASTYEDARITKSFLSERGLSKILIVTDWYHAWRTLLVFERVLGKEVEIGLELSSVPPTDDAVRWYGVLWKERVKALAFHVSPFLYRLWEEDSP
ncbi:YdcF family protein [Spirochaeta thermophila]|uniref:DUF218 domain-containing protein n=1 Tax=Winmispira thermophila (strain ATCC 49972 / DSM 6192 / RI 19.B1) TaxID=665571 RepID=E0RTC4_WINT6|nr:ElyC/SanA/YdcF family protein [Spirochaeta thermophila]ADN00990.1 hypothetical protein STHERM_c00140 [Spirochaeta thermophila DSM 6192]